MAKGKKKMRTIQDIRECEKEFLVPEDVEGVLKCDRYSINLQAQSDPSKLGFPVCVMGSRVRIPRLGFIRWYEWAVLGS